MYRSDVVGSLLRPAYLKKAREDFAKLIAEVVGLDIERVGRGAQTFVAREHDAALQARAGEQLIAAQRRIEEYIRAEQPEPSRQPREHPVGREQRRLFSQRSERFVHRAPM